MPARRARDVDYLFVINGYLMEHKASFVCTLLEQARELPGYKVFVLGATDVDDTLYDPYRRDDLRIHPLAGGRLRQALFNRARVVISRAGYTTVMDLAEHDKRTSLVPAPNQTEQEYLAYHLSGQRYFESLRQGETFDLLSALRACERTRPFDPPWTTEESLRRLTERIDETLHRHFFSIVVPTHNEAAVREFGSELEIRLLRSGKGVSRARNTGLDNLSHDS